MAVEELLVELAHGRRLWPIVPVSGAEDMSWAGRAGRQHQLGVRVAHQVAATLRAGPFGAAVGSLGQVGQAMNGLHRHGNTLVAGGGPEAPG
jgi:hypothetical protein